MNKQSRPSRSPGRPATLPRDWVLINAKVSPEQRDKFRALGGSEWLRKLIDKARP